eukprot:TRINITY_DN3044_c0_g1_i1.p1 TRINITY_DN3044_c0_g1~~TRINITY_DN3044_c0_g1_i1.p1  ORF type:complete len:138 (+),score=30.84 TRINITY_DN3044_c0_g1_i1:37-450(+)
MLSLVCVGARRCSVRQFSVAPKVTFEKKEIPGIRHTKEWEDPNLGFDPALFEGKDASRHDHPIRPASKYAEKVPIKVVDERVAMCDGNLGQGGSLGHPRVYINLDKTNPEQPAFCEYCSQPFVQRQYIPDGHPLLEE